MTLKPEKWVGARVLGCAVLSVLILCGSPAGALAQDQPHPTLITLDADSITVNSVLQILASRSGLNIVTSPEIQKRKISIHLKETPFDEALNLVVRAAGLGYERVGNSILVADAQRLAAPTGLTTRVFDLRYANAQEVRSMLEVVTQEVSANASGTRLVVRGTPSTIEQAASIVESLDRKPQQILLNARLIEVDTSALLEAGIDWEKITKWTTVVTEGAARPSASPVGQVPPDIGYVKFDEASDFYRQLAAFEVTLDLLMTTGKARLLSNAKVITQDGKPAEIFAGETVPVVITSLQSPGSAGGVFQTVQLEKIDVGVKLTIIPRVGDNGFITSVVQPEISRIVAFVGPDDDLPQTSTRRANTLVRVREGQRIFLGGLLSEEKRSTVKKIPLLGDIPILGYLFRHTRNDVQRVDLVIEITPRLVGDEGTPDTEPSPGDSGGQ